MAPADSATLMIHFGMTGDLRWSSRPQPDRTFDRVLFHLGKGTLAYTSTRWLGGVWLARDDDEIEGITGPLGSDALGIDEESFAALVTGRRRRCGGRVQNPQVAGRAAYVCESCQS